MGIRLYVGCTLDHHKRIGVHAVVNARSGELWRNDTSDIQEIERMRDAGKIHAYGQARVRIHQFNSRWFQKRFSHLLADRNEGDQKHTI